MSGGDEVGFGTRTRSHGSIEHVKAIIRFSF